MSKCAGDTAGDTLLFGFRRIFYAEKTEPIRGPWEQNQEVTFGGFATAPTAS